MKKITVLLTTLLLLLSLAGCGEDKKDGKDTAAEDTTAPVTEAAEDLTDTDTKTEDTSADVTETETEGTAAEAELQLRSELFDFGEGSALLLYPVFEDGLHDAFDTAVKNYVNEKKSMTDISGSGVRYEITDVTLTLVTDGLVSAVLEGCVLGAEQTAEYFAYTLNADPVSGRLYTSEELVCDADPLKALFGDGAFELVKGIEGLSEHITPEDMTGGWRDDYGIYPDLYFTETGVGVVVSLPSVLGNYALYEVPFEDAVEFLSDELRPILKKDN